MDPDGRCVTRNCLVAGGPFALTPFAAALGLSKLALHLDTRLLVVAAALDLAQHSFAGHQSAKLANRTLDTAFVDPYFEWTAQDGTVLVDRWSSFDAALVIVSGEFFLCATHSEGRKI